MTLTRPHYYAALCPPNQRAVPELPDGVWAAVEWAAVVWAAMVWATIKWYAVMWAAVQ